MDSITGGKMNGLSVDVSYSFCKCLWKSGMSMGHKFGNPQPANHIAAILVGAPSLKGKPVEKFRYYGANDPRRNSGLAAGY